MVDLSVLLTINVGRRNIIKLCRTAKNETLMILKFAMMMMIMTRSSLYSPAVRELIVMMIMSMRMMMMT